MHVTAIDKEARQVTYKTGQMIRDVWRFIMPYQVRFWGASLARLIGDVVNLYPALAFASVVTYLGDRTHPLSDLYLVFALWALALIVRSLMQYIAKYHGFLVAERVVLDSADNAMRHLTKLDMGWHESENSGNKIKRITTAGDSMRTMVRLWIGNLIEIVVNFVGMLAILSAIDATMALVMLGFMVTYAPLAYFMTRQAAEATYAVHKKSEVVTGLMYEAVGNIRTVNVLNMAAAIQTMVKRALDDCIPYLRRRIMLFQSRNAILELYMQLYRIAALGAIVYGILHGHYELGFLVLFYQYFSRMQESVREVTDVGHEVIAARLAISRMQDMFEVVPKPDGTTAMPVWNRVVMQDVGFAYGDTDVLKSISFTLKRGEKVGVVGLSGAGKSTLFKLLLKERDEYAGTIAIDDIPLRDISRASYFADVAAVLQETEVFNLSLKENVIFGAPAAFDQKTFDQALATAHVTDFLHKLPRGVDTQIGERGVKLSGGERQRLGIARALYRKPQLILMDEATSHLDSDSEEKIQDSLTQVFENATAVVIAHRFSTIRAMDRILVIEGGTIIEEGTFAELQREKGRFHELWEKQRL